MTTRRLMNVRAHLFEGQGGLVRILTDAERFGLTVKRVNLDSVAGDPGLLCLSASFLVGTVELDADQLAARLARHCGVMMVQCDEGLIDPQERKAA